MSTKRAVALRRAGEEGGARGEGEGGGRGAWRVARGAGERVGGTWGAACWRGAARAGRGVPALHERGEELDHRRLVRAAARGRAPERRLECRLDAALCEVAQQLLPLLQAVRRLVAAPEQHGQHAAEAAEAAHPREKRREHLAQSGGVRACGGARACGEALLEEHTEVASRGRQRGGRWRAQPVGKTLRQGAEQADERVALRAARRIGTLSGDRLEELHHPAPRHHLFQHGHAHGSHEESTRRSAAVRGVGGGDVT